MCYDILLSVSPYMNACEYDTILSNIQWNLSIVYTSLELWNKDILLIMELFRAHEPQLMHRLSSGVDGLNNKQLGYFAYVIIPKVHGSHTN